MADFSKDYTPVKRVILPSSTPNDERWVDIYTVPPSGIKFAGVRTDMAKVFSSVRKTQKQGLALTQENIDLPEGTIEVTPDFEYEQVLPMIKAWNFVDGGKPVEPSVAYLKLLQEPDFLALQQAIGGVQRGSTLTEKKS